MNELMDSLIGKRNTEIIRIPEIKALPYVVFCSELTLSYKPCLNMDPKRLAPGLAFILLDKDERAIKVIWRAPNENTCSILI